MGGKTYSSVSMTAGNNLCRPGITSLPVTCISNSGHSEPVTNSDPTNPGSGVTCSDSHVGSSVVLVPYMNTKWPGTVNVTIMLPWISSAKYFK